MDTFENIFQSAAQRKGGEQQLEALLGKPKTKAQLKRMADDRYLAEMTKCIFRAGFVWKIIENKWPDFETVFKGFDTMVCSMLSDEELEVIARDTRIVRNAVKIRTVRDNAQFVQRIRQEHSRFSHWIANWPETDIVGLWAELKRSGARLGGNTSGYFLRFIGKDTFMLSGDVVAALVREGVVDKKPTGRKALDEVQQAFNAWQAESSRSLMEISRTLAFSIDSQH